MDNFLSGHFRMHILYKLKKLWVWNGKDFLKKMKCFLWMKLYYCIYNYQTYLHRFSSKGVFSFKSCFKSSFHSEYPLFIRTLLSCYND